MTAWLLFAVSCCLALDFLIVRDSRYPAERWLQSRPDQSIAGLGRSEYMPRRAIAPWTQIRATPQAVADRSPDLLVVNAGVLLRDDVEAPSRQLYRALADGSTGYRLASQHLTATFWTRWLLGRRFESLVEDQHSNLTKINPQIEIYERAEYWISSGVRGAVRSGDSSDASRVSRIT